MCPRAGKILASSSNLAKEATGSTNAGAWVSLKALSVGVGVNTGG